MYFLEYVNRRLAAFVSLIFAVSQWWIIENPDVRRSTDDPAHIDWVSRVYDGTALSEDEAALLASQLYQRLDHIERAMEGDFLLGGQFSIADISVS